MAGGRPSLERILFRLPKSPWAWYAIVVAPLVLLTTASILSDAFRESVTWPLLLRPVVYDEGYNPLNTFLLAYLLVAGLLWYASLIRVYQVRLDGVFIVGLVLFFAWVSTLRVLEDADFFSPYAPDVGRLGLAGSVACAPGLPGSIWDRCLGLFFVTPLNALWAGLLLFFQARVGVEAQRVGERLGWRQGIRFYALCMAGLVALVGGLWAASPHALRFVPPPWVMAPAALAGLGVVVWPYRRQGRFSWTHGFLGFTLFWLVGSAYAIGAWFLRADPVWRPTQATNAWVLLVVGAAPAILVLGCRGLVRAFESRGGRPTGTMRTGAALAYLLLLESFGIMLGVAGIADLAAGRAAIGVVLLVVGAGLVAAAAFAGRAWVRRLGSRFVVVFGTPIALTALGAQMADAFMTSLAIDWYDAEEKHVLPRMLIAMAASLLAGSGLAAFSATLVMLPYKLLATLLFVGLLETYWRPSAGPGSPVLWVLYMGVIVMGATPAVRDALRLAMGV